MLKYQAIFVSLAMLMSAGLWSENEGMVTDKIMPCIYPPFPGCGQSRLQKLYVTADRIIMTDQYIMYVDYNGYVQTTPGVFADQGGLYVFSMEPGVCALEKTFSIAH